MTDIIFNIIIIVGIIGVALFTGVLAISFLAVMCELIEKKDKHDQL